MCSEKHRFVLVEGYLYLRLTFTAGGRQSPRRSAVWRDCRSFEIFALTFAISVRATCAGARAVGYAATKPVFVTFSLKTPIADVYIQCPDQKDERKVEENSFDLHFLHSQSPTSDSKFRTRLEKTSDGNRKLNPERNQRRFSRPEEDNGRVGGRKE